jgi:O-antigen/teichoic acid export membrane protein
MAGLRRELAVPLFRNAYALMLNTVVNSGLGLLYWIVAAHEFSAAEVGRGSALVSLMVLVSTVTQLNFAGALVRFLPRAGSGARGLLLSAYGIAAAVAVLGTTAVMAYCHFALRPGDALWVSLPFAAWFVVSTTAWSLFNLQDAALTGLRSAIWVPLENGTYGLVKLVLLLIVAHTAQAEGVFTSWSLPVIALLVPVNLLIFRRILPRHAAEGAADEQPARPATLSRYMAGDYAAQLFSQLSSTFLPVLVVSLLGAEQGAYFLPAQTIFGAIGMLSTAITSALVVEAAKDPQHAHRHARAVLRRICVIVLPAAVVVTLAAPLVLSLFGADYRAQATTVLQLMMASIFPRVIVSLYVTKCRLENRTFLLAILQLVQAVILIAATVALAPALGLAAVGWAALAAEVVPGIAVTAGVVRWLRSDARSASSARADARSASSARADARSASSARGTRARSRHRARGGRRVDGG